MVEQQSPTTTISITREAHRRLEALKIHRREPMGDIVDRLLELADTLDAGGGHDGRLLDTLGHARSTGARGDNLPRTAPRLSRSEPGAVSVASRRSSIVPTMNQG